MRFNDKSEPSQSQSRQVLKNVVDLRLPLVEGKLFPWRHDRPSMRVAIPTDEVIRVARSLDAEPGAFVVGGGEPMRRSDAAEMLSELARIRPDHLGLCTAGEGLGEAVVRRLQALGVRRVHIPFHCGRQDAHDWLVGRPGSLKTAHSAIRACVAAGMPVVAEVVLTRPTMPHLAETVEVLARTGVGRVCVRRLLEQDAHGAEFVPLSPRLELLRESLERAAAVALERRMHLVLRDLPLCSAPRLSPLFATVGSELWVLPDGTTTMRNQPASGCATCPGTPQCAGGPADYVARFGWEEFADADATAVRVRENVVEQQQSKATAPMVFVWPGPRRVRCEPCSDAAGDVDKGRQPHESTRAIRARIVQAARFRPSMVRLVGSDLLAHPQAAQLIYDAVRLFARVEVAGEGSPVVDWSDLDLRRLKDLARMDFALFGADASSHDGHCGIPGAFAAMSRAFERLRTETVIPVGTYAVVHDASEVRAFVEAWQEGSFPGEPRFRLSGRGGSLDEVIEFARGLEPGPAQSALRAVLPRCLVDFGADFGEGDAIAAELGSQQKIDCGRSVSYRPLGTDPIGAFEMCREDGDACGVPGCPGTAVGWQSTARSKRWTVNT